MILEDDHPINESSTSKSIEETEEFKKAVESFDEIFQSESGDQSPESKRLSKKLDTSPNNNWKRIKTSKSLEAEDSVQMTEIRHETEQHSSVFVTEIVSETSADAQQPPSEEEGKKKISLLGDQYSSMEDSNDEVKKSLDGEEQEIPNPHLLGEQEIIDPHLLRNVDGPPRQRKGSSRFSKKQKSKSPGGGARSSYSESEGLSESEGKWGLSVSVTEADICMKMDMFTCWQLVRQNIKQTSLSPERSRQRDNKNHINIDMHCGLCLLLLDLSSFAVALLSRLVITVLTNILTLSFHPREARL